MTRPYFIDCPLGHGTYGADTEVEPCPACENGDYPDFTSITPLPPLADCTDTLYDICDEVHAHCNCECPVFSLNENKPVNPLESDYGCDCFKDGAAMYNFIRKARNI